MELLEREPDLDLLRSLLRATVSSRGQVALVVGEAGIGKTSLVERFTREQGGAGRVLWGACDALFTPRPLCPLHDIAAQTGGELAAVLRSGENRHAIFTACLDEFQDGPTIVVFEDVHWADEATLDLLMFLGRRIRHTSTLLIVTYRDDELSPHHPLRTVLGALTPAIATRVALRPLSEQAVKAMIGDCTWDAGTLHRQTGGNPFFLTEVLAHAAAGIPPTVNDAVLARAARLTASAREVLEAAAVIGARTERWLLAEVSGGKAGAADECVAIGVLLVQGDTLAFRHELARQSIFDSILPHRRTVLHRLVLDALRASLTGQADLTRLTHHAEAAEDHAALLELAPAAAYQAGASGAHREAAALYALALRHAGASPADRHATLLEAYAEHCSRIDRRDDAIDARRKAIALWREAGDALKEGENYASLVIMLIGTGRNSEAEQASRAAIALFETQTSMRHLALGYETWAALRDFDSDYAEALAWCEKIVALPGLDRQTYEWRRACMRRGAVRMFLDYDRGCAELELLLSHALAAVQDDHRQDKEAANLYQNLGVRSTAQFRFRRAERYLAEGLAYIADRDLYMLRNLMLAAQALTRLYQGDWNTAKELAESVLRRAGASAISRIIALEALARARARRGDPGGSAALDEGLTLAIPTGNIQRIGPVRAARAEAAWLADDHAGSGAEARTAYDLAVAKRQPWIAGELAFWRWCAGDDVPIPGWIAAPFALQIAGDWRGAAAAWEGMGCRYEQARALADGDTAAQLAALAIFDQLGARPAAEGLRSRLRGSGVSSIPRGPRSATRDHRFGLTTREAEILAELSADRTNVEIAARLHLSTKTVGHHVSAVLAKLHVHSRKAAARLDREQRLQVQDKERILDQNRIFLQVPDEGD